MSTPHVREAYLRALYGDPDGLVGISMFAPSKVSRAHASPATAAAEAGRLDATGAAGVYHRGTTLNGQPAAGRGLADDSAAVYFYAIDADTAGPGHRASNLPPDREAVEQAIGESGFPAPTTWVASGGGFYPQWWLDEPVDLRHPDDLARVKQVFDRLQAHLAAVWADHGWKLDPTADLARVWRLPGTTNRKVATCPVVATWEGDSGRRYHLDDLLSVATRTPPQRTETVAAQRDAAHASGAPWQRSRAEGEIAKYLGTVTRAVYEAGAFNNTLNAAAVRLGHFVPIFGTYDDAYAALANKCAEVFGHADEADLATIRSGLAAGMREPYAAMADIPPATSLGLAPLPPVVAHHNPAPTTGGGLNLPEEFWSRESLKRIRQAAHSRGRSGDVVLASALAIVAASAPFNRIAGKVLTVDTGIGARGQGLSLNLVIGIVGPSGAGKSTGTPIAEDLIKTAQPPMRYPLGSGEGLVQAFLGEVRVETGDPDKRGDAKTVLKKNQQIRWNALFELDEGGALAKMWDRRGSTLGETLRSAFSGSGLGQQNAYDESTRRLPPRAYAMAVVIGFQPETTLPLLADVAVGTPQRVLWAWATDPTIPPRKLRPPWPGEILSPFEPSVPTDIPTPGPAIATPREWGLITIADEVLDEIHLIDEMKGTGTLPADHPLSDPYRSQHPALRIKVAVLLALIDGRRRVDAEDWRLAALVLDTSDRIRLHLQALERAAMVEQRTAKAATEGVMETSRAEARHEVADRVADERVQRAAVWAAIKVRETGGSCTRGALRKRADSKVRRYFDDALAYAVDRGWLAERAGEYTVGDSRPEGL